MDTGHLLLISVGPIQDFIDSARRCQDLWFGSWLLSELARVTAASVGAAGARVIFPAGLAAAEEGRERPGVANLILVSLPGGASPRRVAMGAREVQQARLKEIAAVAWEKILGDPHFHREIAYQQLDELIEFLWVSVPLSGPEGYAEARRAAVGRLAALKNSRLWRQPGWTGTSGAGVPKSSIDGERESVLHERLYERGADLYLSPRQRRQRFGIKGAERLCGVSLLKRLGVEVSDEEIFQGRRPLFHSTSHVALTPLMDRLRRHPRGPAAARKYLSTLQKLGLDTDRFRLSAGPGAPSLEGHDGALLLESRLPEHFKQESGDSEQGLQEGPLLEAARALKELLRAVDYSGEPCPYYAFLLADGDQMGAAIDGIRTMEGHIALAGALNAFAQGCREIVSKHRGTLIFSGGDDVLALLPLHTALACARELAEVFAGQLQPLVEEHWQPNATSKRADRPKTTLSVGLGVSHCREPMSEARALAKKAEKLAKKERSSLAILVDKRSGAAREAAGEWDEAPLSLDRRLEEWLKILAAGELSAKTPHDIERVAAHFEGLSPEEQRERFAEISSLLKQVLERKRQQGGGGKSSEEARAMLIQSLEASSEAPVAGIYAMVSELLIAKLLQQARSDAGEVQP